MFAPLTWIVPPTVGLRSPAQPLMQMTSRILGFAGAVGPEPEGTEAPPAAAAIPAEPARSDTNVIAMAEAIRRCGALAMPCFANCPLFPRPAELADGLALKELRYGLVRPIRP